MVGLENEHRTMVEMFKKVDAELKIIIAGNHDMTLDEDYYHKHGHKMVHRIAQARSGNKEPEPPADLARIRELYCGEEAKRAGIVYLEEGVRSFTLRNGARFTIYTSPYQPEFCNMAFGYPRSVDRFNPPGAGVEAVFGPAMPAAEAGLAPDNPVPSFPGVDIMLTHGPPKGIMDEVAGSGAVGCTHLNHAATRARPRLHCFGHIHEGYGARRVYWPLGVTRPIAQDKEVEMQNRHAYVDVSRDGERPLKYGEETLFVNAAIMTKSYVPTNAPWVVDIELPSALDD